MAPESSTLGEALARRVFLAVFLTAGLCAGLAVGWAAWRDGARQAAAAEAAASLEASARADRFERAVAARAADVVAALGDPAVEGALDAAVDDPDRVAAVAALRERLASALADHADALDALGLVDDQGEVVVARGTLTEGPSAEAVSDARGAGAVRLQELQRDREGRPVVDAVVARAGGAGAWVLRWRLEALGRVVDAPDGGGGVREVRLLGPDGAVWWDGDAPTEGVAPARIPGMPGRPDAVALVRVDLGEGPLALAMAPVPGQPLGIAVGHPVPGGLGVLAAVAGRTLGLALLLGLVAAWVAAWAHLRIAQPLAAVARLTEAVSRGASSEHQAAAAEAAGSGLAEVVALRDAVLGLARAVRGLDDGPGVAADRSLVRAQALAQLGSFERDVERGTLRWSDEMYRLLGLPADGASTPSRLLASVLPEDRPAVARWLDRRPPADGPPTALEFRVQRPAGDVRVLQATMGRHVLPDGRDVDVGALLDVTARKAVEGALVRAKDEAERADASKSSFLATMSHEIRTPMAAILGLTELMLDTPLTRRQHRHLDRIDASARTLLGILDDILDFAKVEAGKLDIERTPFDLDRVLEDTAFVLAVKAANAELRIDVALDGTVPCALVGDPLRLGQVLLNLGSNAVKFTETGSVRLAVHTVQGDAQRVYLRFEVIDTGIGIPKDQLDTLFEPFTQADTSTSRRYGGTGLGLAISRALVERMGGTMGVESRLGEGSTFWFQLPLARDMARPEVGRPPAAFRGGAAWLVGPGDLLPTGPFRGLGIAVRRAERASQPIPHDVDFVLCAASLAEEVAEARGERDLPVVSVGDVSELHNDLTSDASIVRPVTARRLVRALENLAGYSVAERAAKQGGGRVEGARVLLAEDNPVNQMVAKGHLERLGVEVLVVDDGQQALQALRREPFDLVLMDMQMPHVDGLEATRAIRRDARFADIPVIALTANVLAADREACRQAGMDDFLGKPVRREALRSALERWIRPSEVEERVRPA